MLTPMPSRIETRKAQQPIAKSRVFNAPISGLFTNKPRNIPAPLTAVVMDNFYPTTRAIELRRGVTKEWTTGYNAPIELMFEYIGSAVPEKFAVCNSAANMNPVILKLLAQGGLEVVYRYGTSPDYDDAIAIGRVSFVEFGAVGSNFLIAVDGKNKGVVYDGSDWEAFTYDEIDSANLSYVWVHNGRVFFIENGSLNAWYLSSGVAPVADSTITNGETTITPDTGATRLPLWGIFQKGGHLIFGGVWSSDSGAGLEDRCVFMTNKGEVAVYSGNDPGNINNWQLNGVYDIGNIISPYGFFHSGGDLTVLTDLGLVPMSAAVYKDPSQFKASSMSRAIEDALMKATSDNRHGRWEIARWDSESMLVMSPAIGGPGNDYCYVSNLETGAWTRFTGWNIRTMRVMDNRLFFGDTDGNIFECFSGGDDDGAIIDGRVCFSFDYMESPGAYKSIKAIRPVWECDVAISGNIRVSVASDFSPNFAAYDFAEDSIDEVELVLWNSALWGTNWVLGPSVVTLWDASGWDVPLWDISRLEDAVVNINDRWKYINKGGYALAPQIQMLTRWSQSPGCRLISVELMYSEGGVLV